MLVNLLISPGQGGVAMLFVGTMCVYNVQGLVLVTVVFEKPVSQKLR